MKRSGLFAALFGSLAFASPSHAFLVNYEFQGFVTHSAVSWANAGDRMTGRLSFNPLSATPADTEYAPGVFDFAPDEIRLEVNIGPYSFLSRQTSGAGAWFGQNGFSMQEMIFDDPNSWGRMHMGAEGNGLFKDPPLTTLDGAKWHKVNAGQPWSVETYNEGYANSVDGQFTLFRYVRPPRQVASSGGGGSEFSDAHPNPEPATWMLMGAGLTAFGAYRRRRKASAA